MRPSTHLALALVAVVSAGSAEAAPARSSFIGDLQDISGALAPSGAGLRRSLSASRQEEDTLLELLSDRDPQVRRQAVHAFKAYVARRSSHRDRVLEMALDRREETAVRYEAIKTLSAVCGYREVYDALLDLGRGSETPGLRGIAYKSLYPAAASRSDVRDALADTAKRAGGSDEARLGAIWGLFLATLNSSARDPLVDIARRDSDEAARVEALKSLFGAMGYHEVRELAEDLARDSQQPAAVRRAAILLHAARTSGRQRDLLEDIARRDVDPEARRAAILALGDPRGSEIARYFHWIRRDQNGLPVDDPLDAE